MCRYLLLVFAATACFSARAQERFLSKLYFPGLVGLLFYPGSYHALQGASNKNLSVSIGFTTTLF